MKNFLKTILEAVAGILVTITLLAAFVWVCQDELFPRVEVVQTWPDRQIVRVRVLEEGQWVTKPPSWLRTYTGPASYVWGPTLPELVALERK